MQCPQCQHENPEGARFCNSCGARLETTCPQCGHTNPPGSRFCNGCGQPLAARPAPSTAAPALPSPESYTPKHLAERILTSRGALEGERKQVTVLFADLKGSMELLADRDPEEARRILDPVLERMMDAVHRYEGTVNQVMGDGIMVLFGAPLAHEDHAVRACYAALRMQEAVRQYAEEIFSTHGIRPQIRVGFNSGEVVVRAIGSDLRMDYTAVGQTTHLAARMEQTALPGSILLAPDTLRLAEGYLQVKALGPVSIKGLDAPIDVYEVVGAGLARSRLQAAASRGLTKFVGRDAELEVLRQTLDRAGSGHGQVVALVGEPGVGKSRLTWEFTHSHRAQGWLVLESGSVSYGKATSWLPVTDLLKTYYGIDTADDQRRIREKLTGKLLTLDRTLEPTLPALLALLDVPVDDPAWAALDPPQRRQRTLEACKRLVLRESQEQPLLLVFEDLHWIDTETQALLDSLVESLPAARILLLVNYRPEYEHSWHRKTYSRELRLDPLPPESAEAPLGALVGGDASLPPLKRLLIERTEGNPFFLEESVRTLVETSTLVGERGAYRLAKPAESTQVPATVQAVLAARIDRLAPEDKRLLQSAAVIGKDVLFPLLRAVVDEPEERLREGLARLRAGEFLYETSLFPEVEYTFKHALTHEVAYGSLLQERRRALHARIVAAIEALYPDRQAEQVERLAHHSSGGELWEKAAGYCHQAGVRAFTRSAHREAVAHLEHALAAVERLPRSRETTAQAIDLRLDLRNALHPLGNAERILTELRQAEMDAQVLDDQPRLGRISTYQATYLWQMGENDHAVAAGRRALVITTGLGDVAAQAEATYRLGLVYNSLGDYVLAIDLLGSFVASPSDRLQDGRLLLGLPVTARGWLAMCHAELGDFDMAIRVGEEAVRMAEPFQVAFDLVMARVGLGYVHLRRGHLQEAIRHLQRGLGVCDERRLDLLVATAASSLGYAYLLAGDLAEALPLLERGVNSHQSLRLRATLSLWLAYLGEGYLRAGRRQDATNIATRALALARDQHERGREAWALRLHGEIASHADPPAVEEAEAHYQQALALAEELGMRPLAAHCHLGLGSLYQRAGLRERAQFELST